MNFSGIYSTAIAFCLASIAVQIFGELILLQHPSTDNGSTNEYLTYSAKEANAAHTSAHLVGRLHREYEKFISQSEKSGGLSLSRKARSLDSLHDQLSAAELYVYEADPEKNTISLRLSPLDPTVGNVEKYKVYLIRKPFQDEPEQMMLFEFRGGGLECTLWENSVCLENIALDSSIKLANDRKRNAVYGMKVEAEYQGQRLKEWHVTFPLGFYKDVSSWPTNYTLTAQSHGIVTLKWGHPLFPRTKIEEFRIFAVPNETNLLSGTHSGVEVTYVRRPFKQVEKMYQVELRLLTSTEYFISILAINQNGENSIPAGKYFRVPSEVTFATDEDLQVNRIETSIELRIPGVVNATRDTWINVTMKGSLMCTPNQSPELTSPASYESAETEWMVAESKVDDHATRYCTFDANETIGTLLSCYLHPGATYEIMVKVEDKYTGQSDTRTSSPISFTPIDDRPLIPTPNGQELNLVWLIILPIVAICLLLFYIWYNRIRKRVSKQPREPSYLEILPPLPKTARRGSSTLLSSPKISVSVPGAAENRSSAPMYCLPDQPDSRSVSAEYFEQYAKEANASGILYSQFALLPRGLTRSCEYGRLPENIAKNGYRNLIAYDETRVVLKKIPGDAHSDYINASYMKGYKREKAYIAAQGPQPNTVNDFWRMIWQEEVRVICMLVNVIEGEKKMCEKYWPDVGTRVKYGDFLISNADHQVFADYTFRTLKLSYKQETRKVMHLHYTGWPSLGVPIYPQSLVAFLKKLGHTPTGNGPVVVHCNTGDNRTGTIILCDICIRQALSERMIDVTAETRRMRDSRTNMVGTLQHYILAHIVIGESLVLLPTQVPCTDDLPDDIERMKQKLPFDMQRLNDTMWQEEALRSLDGPGPSTVEDVANDDLPELLADGSEVVYADVVGIEKNRMNAVSVDGVTMKKQYQASCLPSPFTLPDFWRFVAESQIKLIIILQCSDPTDPICCDILPDESTVDGLPEIRVKNKTSLVEGDYLTNEELLLTETSQENGKPQSVTVLTCKGWGRENNGKPPKPVALVSLWKASEKIPREGGQTLVLCHDGITGCGLYLALSFLLERMAVERECDVISAIRAVRRSKREFMQSLDQCEYLYDAAKTYAAYFQCYANFT